MPCRTRTSTSTPATPSSEATTLDSTEQTLTPATCLSETSSNIDASNAAENHPKPEKSTRRATRASLKSESTPAITDTDNDVNSDKAQAVATESLAVMPSDQGKQDNSTARRSLRTSRSRHSLANELSQDVDEDKDNSGKVVSEAVGSETTEIDCQKGAKMEIVSHAEEKRSTDGKRGPSKEDMKSRRRSTRISLLEKSAALINGASSVLGKRQRDSKDGAGKAKVSDRRASLRPRSVKEAPQPPASDAVSAKSQRSSKDKVESSKHPMENNPSQPPAPVKPVPYKRKKWLSHGLYAGQNTYTEFVMPTSKKRKNANRERTLFPMPKYSGAKLLETGRNFRLPFDIFSPLPRGQPKPDEWRKINKSKDHSILNDKK